jgi:hypothetical protein
MDSTNALEQLGQHLLRGYLSTQCDVSFQYIHVHGTSGCQPLVLLNYLS